MTRGISAAVLWYNPPVHLRESIKYVNQIARNGVATFGWLLRASRILPTSPKQRQIDELRHTKHTPIARAMDGKPVKLVGTLRYASDSIPAPFTTRRCAGWEATVLRCEPTDGDLVDRWVPLVEDQGACDFILEDDTGRALVECRHVTIASLKDADYRVGADAVANDVLRRFMTKHHRKHAFDSGFALHWKESVLVEGERVAVLGTGRWMLDPEAPAHAYRDRLKRLVISGSPKSMVIVSDDPSDCRA